MFTEIKLLKNAKQKIHDEYKDNYNKCFLNEREYLDTKYEHSYDCLSILKKIRPKKYLKYSVSILLHDIGRFSEYKNIKGFSHAQYGYEILKENFTNDPLILFPVKYHESGDEWIVELYQEKEFQKCNNQKKIEIIDCCNLVRDIDVISNMKSILKSCSNNKYADINYDLVKVLERDDLADKEMIKNEYDKIIYILCGLSIITDEKSFKYIKKYSIVKNLINKLFDFVEQSNLKNLKTTKEIKDLIYEKYNI